MLLILLFRHESEVDRLKPVCVQTSEELHMLLETSARNRMNEIGGPLQRADVVAKRSGYSRQLIGFVAPVMREAPTVLYTLLMDCRPVSNVQVASACKLL
ncbi:hypothetical protein AVEN_104493-1 [Araneus ventricosus]|uniref:Uncharacterized protein n=1 Tax=Araneus ventricosus TaxID=182803 RepID=A0A4Y2QER0_ARAVE|nr:hypothetical protein AVEN_104493-1 [Araneus ventricosus]